MDFIREHFGLVMVWVLAISISIVSFIALQKAYPPYLDVLLGHTLYTIPAMPNSFLHLIGFYMDSAAHHDLFFWLLAGAYWAAIGAAHYWYFEEREGKYVLVIALLVLSSSVKWLYFAVAFIHG